MAAATTTTTAIPIMTSSNNAFSTSTSSAFRASQSQSQSVSGNGHTYSYTDNALTQLPNVDFNFEDLRKRMADFTVKFDAFIERGRKRVLEERNEFRGRIGELNEEQRSTSTQITTLHSTLSTHNHMLSREQAEKREIQSQITGLETHHTTQHARRDRLRTSIATTQRAIDAKLAAQREYGAKMDGQARQNGPELTFWESYLGCRIEGAGDEDLIRIVYTFPPASAASSSSAATGPNARMNINTTTSTGVNGHATSTSKEEREATFELKVPASGGCGYQIAYMKPKLDDTKVQKVVDRLNETRDIAVLLKGMRGLFGEQMK